MNLVRGITSWVGALVLVGSLAARAAKDVDQYEFAEGLFVHQDYKSAAEEFKRFVADFPNSERLPAAMFRIGEAYLRLEQNDLAAAAFEAALARFPKVKEAALGSYNLGRARLKLDQPEPALAAFQQAATLDKADVREQSLVGAAECLIRLKRLPDAATAYLGFLQEFPQSRHRAEVLFSCGWVQASLGQHQEAAQAYATLIQEFPNAPDLSQARLALSDCYTALGQFAKSVEVLDALQADKALAADVLLRRAWNQFKSGDRKQAAQTFRQFAAQYPQNPLATPALHNAGIALFETKEYQAAAESFTQALASNQLADGGPERAEAGYWLGFCQFNLGDHAAALKTIAPLLERPDALAPEKREGLTFVRAQCLEKTASPQEAVTAYDAFLQAFPASTHASAALYCLATNCERSGQLDRAVATLEKLVTQHPKCELRNDALFALGEYLYRLKQPQKALPYLTELAAAGVDTDKLNYRLGWTCFDLGDYERSGQAFAKLAETNSPLAAEAAYLAGRAAEELKAPERAIGFYEKLAQRQTPDEFSEKALHRLSFLYQGEKAVANAERYRALFPQGGHAAELRLRLAEASFARGDVDAAARHYTELLAGDLPAALQATANYGLAWCLLKQDKPDAADACFAKVPTDDLASPVAADALLQRGEIAYRRQQYDVARPAFEKLKDQPPPRGERALYMLGWSCRRLNDNTGATTAFANLLERFPQGQFAADAIIRLGEARLAAKQYPEARDLLKTGLDRSDLRKEQREELLHLYCDALAATEQWPEAIKWNQALLEQCPDSKRAFLACFRLGVANQAVGLYDEAEKQFRATIEKTDTIEAAQAQFNLGAVDFARQRYTDAAKSFLRVEMLYDYGDLAPKALYHAIDAFRRAGETDRANLYLAKLREKYPGSSWTKKAQEP